MLDGGGGSHGDGREVDGARRRRRGILGFGGCHQGEESKRGAAGKLKTQHEGSPFASRGHGAFGVSFTKGAGSRRSFQRWPAAGISIQRRVACGHSWMVGK